MATHRTPTQISPTRKSTARRIAVAGCTLALGAGVLLGAAPAGAIVNGSDADAGEYPWMVALTSPDGEQFCGGSIVAETKVLTAAHCLEGERPSGVFVRAGATRLDDDSAQVRGVVGFQIHDDPERNDIAVLHLAEPFDFGGSVQAIGLADADAHRALLDHGSPAVVTGWGATSENGGGTNRLQETTLTVLGDRQCRDRFGDEIVDEVMVCANHVDGNDSCYGDSGGPLVVRDPDSGRWFQLGVVSFGITECGDTAGVYSEVPAFRAFVEQGAPDDPDSDGDTSDDGGWDGTGWDDEWDDGWDDDSWDDSWDDDGWDGWELDDDLGWWFDWWSDDWAWDLDD